MMNSTEPFNSESEWTLATFQSAHQSWMCRKVRCVANGNKMMLAFVEVGENGNKGHRNNGEFLECRVLPSAPDGQLDAANYVASYSVGLREYETFVAELARHVAHACISHLRTRSQGNGQPSLHVLQPSAPSEASRVGLQRPLILQSQVSLATRCVFPTHRAVSADTRDVRTVAVDQSELDEFLQCLMHYTWCRSAGRYVVEASHVIDGVIEVFRVHTTSNAEPVPFGHHYNGGRVAATKCLRHHRCALFCKALKLPPVAPHSLMK